MNINRIEELLSRNRESILSANTFAERLEVVYNLLDNEFPQTSEIAALHGPITSLVDFMSRTELEPLMYAIKNSSKTGTEFLVTDEEINDILQSIYSMIK